MKELRVIIAGSRNFNDYQLLKKSAIDILTTKTMLPKLVKIISGTARAQILSENVSLMRWGWNL